MYHRVGVLTPDAHHLCIAPDTFRAHIAELRERYCPLDLVQFAHQLAAGDLPPGAVAVTLDDGCYDNLVTASPILTEFEVPATFFVPTERLDERREYWWDIVERAFFSTTPLPSSLDLPDIGVLDTKTAPARQEAHRLLASTLRNLPADARDSVVAAVCAWAGCDVAPRDSHRPMVADEVRDLSTRPGHAIGAHGVRHVRLTRVAAEQRRVEMIQSKQALERLIGAPVTAFAYPYGDWDADTQVLAQSIFAVAVTATPGTARGDSHPLALPRFDAGVMSRADLVATLHEAFRVDQR